MLRRCLLRCAARGAPRCASQAWLCVPVRALHARSCWRRGRAVGTAPTPARPSEPVHCAESGAMAAPTDTLCMGCADAACDFKPLRLQRRPLGEGDVLIEMKYCGICHSDGAACSAARVRTCATSSRACGSEWPAQLRACVPARRPVAPVAPQPPAVASAPRCAARCGALPRWKHCLAAFRRLAPPGRSVCGDSGRASLSACDVEVSAFLGPARGSPAHNTLALR